MSAYIEDIDKPQEGVQHLDTKLGHEDITLAEYDETKPAMLSGDVSREQRDRLIQLYGRKAEEDDIAPSRDVQMILDRVVEMSEEEALQILVEAIDFHKIDPNFPSWTMRKLKQLVQGYKACDMAEEDWSFDLKTEAAMLKYHSPYPEVRAVTDPFDDPNQPVETVRAYVLGIGFMAGATALNTFFAPRQPAISLAAIVMQLLLAPCGWFWARVVPNWSFTVPFIHKKVSLNLGPWTYKEQCFSTILFTIVNGAGGAYGLYLVRECEFNKAQLKMCIRDDARILRHALAELGLRDHSRPLHAGARFWIRRTRAETGHLPRQRHLAECASHSCSEPSSGSGREEGDHQRMEALAIPLFPAVLWGYVHLFLASQRALPSLARIQLDDVDRAGKLRVGNDHRFLRRDGVQSACHV